MKAETLELTSASNGGKSLYDLRQQVTFFLSDLPLEIIAFHLSAYLQAILGHGGKRKSETTITASSFATVLASGRHITTCNDIEGWHLESLRTATATIIPILCEQQPTELFACYQGNREKQAIHPRLFLSSNNSLDCLDNTLSAGCRLDELTAWWKKEEEQNAPQLSLLRPVVQKAMPAHCYLQVPKKSSQSDLTLTGRLLDGVRLNLLNEQCKDRLCIIMDLARRFILAGIGCKHPFEQEGLVLMFGIEPSFPSLLLSLFPNLQVLATISRLPQPQDVTFSCMVYDGRELEEK